MIKKLKKQTQNSFKNFHIIFSFKNDKRLSTFFNSALNWISPVDKSNEKNVNAVQNNVNEILIVMHYK